MKSSHRLQFCCCICNSLQDPVLPGEPGSMVVMTHYFEEPEGSKGKEQQWWAHTECFKSALHPEIQELHGGAEIEDPEEWEEMPEDHLPPGFVTGKVVVNDDGSFTIIPDEES